VGAPTSVARLERQRIYVGAMKPQVLALSNEEVVRVMDAINDYLGTNIGSRTVLDLAEKLRNYQGLPELTIDGTNTIDGEHVAYILDEDSLQQVILQLFYQEKTT